MAGPQQIPQRFGNVSNPLSYEALTRLQQYLTTAFRHGRTSCGTIQASARIEMWNPVARIQGTADIKIIETPLFGSPLCVFAVDGFSFVTGGNIGAEQDVPAGTGAVLQYDEERELWYVYGGLMKDFIAGSGISLSETTNSITISSTAAAEMSFSGNKNGSNQTINASSWTLVTFTTEEWDQGTCYDAPNSRFLPGVAGRYDVTACVLFGTTSATPIAVTVGFYVSGALVRGVTHYVTDERVSLVINAVLNLSATDYVEVYIYHNSAGAETVYGGATQSYFCAHNV